MNSKKGSSKVCWDKLTLIKSYVKFGQIHVSLGPSAVPQTLANSVKRFYKVFTEARFTSSLFGEFHIQKLSLKRWQTWTKLPGWLDCIIFLLYYPKTGLLWVKWATTPSVKSSKFKLKISQNFSLIVGFDIHCAGEHNKNKSYCTLTSFHCKGWLCLEKRNFKVQITHKKHSAKTINWKLFLYFVCGLTEGNYWRYKNLIARHPLIVCNIQPSWQCLLKAQEFCQPPNYVATTLKY